MNPEKNDSIALTHSNNLFEEIDVLIPNAKGKVAIYVNAETPMLYFNINENQIN